MIDRLHHFSRLALSGAMAALFSVAVLAQAPAAPAGRGTPPAPTPPCGPGSKGKNIASDSRCFELRMYTADPSRDGVGQFKGGINELHQRFREKEVELFVKHGAEIVRISPHCSAHWTGANARHPAGLV